MTPDAKKLVALAANGNADAEVFLTQLLEVIHFWDDLIDRDKGPMTDHHINRMMKWALIDIPRSQFYQTYFTAFQTLLWTSLQNWLTSIELERHGSDHDRQVAFITRSSYVDIIIFTANLCGGDELASKVSMEARRLTHEEGYAGYLANLQAETVKRTA